ncbi:chorismate-binding protein [Labilibacter marinus]|uniref:chorismate-binding protein n=1 Tax=Labilibacter marinus TaxID=1477105 RepID=UPI00083483D2|nr:chorismate-binding protein [Labilibacter marinus]
MPEQRGKTVEKVSQSEVLEYCIQKKIPFAIYKLPQQEENTLIVSRAVQETSINEMFHLHSDAYVFAPFSLKNQNPVSFKADYIINAEIADDVFEEIKSISGIEEEKLEATFYADYTAYKEQFGSMFSAIESRDISKAILSRIKHVADVSRTDAGEFYGKLSKAYPRAYTFMIYTPQSGLWTGASPELLFRAEDKHGTTVSLAGTRKNNGLDNWNAKEQEEQQIVTDFVNEIMLKYGVEDVSVQGPETIQAGKMSHLKTQYNFPLQYVSDKMGEFVNDLHPTPAVCGLPKQASMDLIEKIEQHQRTFYAGFLGRMQKQDMSLFVNIRSMKFVDGGVDLYLGGGITEGSDVEKEWQETELKSQTMLSVLKELK